MPVVLASWHLEFGATPQVTPRGETPLGPEFPSASALTVVRGREGRLLVYDKTTGRALLFEVVDDGSLRAQSQIELGSGHDLLDSFVLGNRTHLLCYRAENGQISVFEVVSSDRVIGPFTYFRTREPGITTGFSTIKAFTSYDQVGLLGYNDQTGYVALYNVTTIPESLPGIPPIRIANTWAHQWAQGWTRFAFFTHSGSVFFLKTNTWRPNVNIDHVWDRLHGTVEVKSHLDLANAQTLEHVLPLLNEAGDPFFLAYEREDAVIYRFHGDCAGWTEIARATLAPNIVAFSSIALKNSVVIVGALNS